MTRTRLVPVDGVEVEVEVAGSGVPVLVVSTALDADELRPLTQVLAAAGGLEVLHLTRPGYGASAAARAPGIAADADLATALLTALDTGPAHVVGASYSAAVVLALAARHPSRVRAVTAVETPPAGTTGATAFRDANRGLRQTYDEHGVAAALDELARVVGPLPPVPVRDATTFLCHDVEALLTWELTDDYVAGMGCPVDLVQGGNSHPWFAEMADRLERLLPGATRTTVPGAGHDVARTDPEAVAAVVLERVAVSRTNERRSDPTPRS